MSFESLFLNETPTEVLNDNNLSDYNGSSQTNDPRSLILKKIQLTFNDITLELVTYGTRNALLVEGAVSENKIGSKSTHDDRSSFAGRSLKMLIDDLPHVIDDSRYGKPTLKVDITKYSFVPDSDINNFNNFANNSPIYTGLSNSNRPRKK